jgi:hypothetical protein
MLYFNGLVIFRQNPTCVKFPDSFGRAFIQKRTQLHTEINSELKFTKMSPKLGTSPVCSFVSITIVG